MPVAVCLFQPKKDKDWVTPKAGMGADAIRCSAEREGGRIELEVNMSRIKKRLEIQGYLTSTWARSKFVCEFLDPGNLVLRVTNNGYA